MTWTDWNSPSANDIFEATGAAFSTPDNAHAADDAFASASVPKNGGTSDTHRWTGFGFTDSDIPDGSVINGVEVRLLGDFSLGNPANCLIDVWLYDASNGQSPNSDTDAFASASDGNQVTTFGGAADLFGNGSISADDVRTATFGVLIEGTNNGTDGGRALRLDHIEVRFDYTDSSPPSASGALQAGAGVISGAALRAAFASGVMQAQLAAIVAQASREAKAQGALQAQAAVIDGTSTGTAEASGTLQAQASTVAGTSVREVKASGALAAQSSSLIGSALIYIEGLASGALQAGASVVAGAASRTISASGAVQSGLATVIGTTTRTIKTTSAAIAASAAAIAGVIKRIWYTESSPGEVWADTSPGSAETWYEDTPGPGETWTE